MSQASKLKQALARKNALPLLGAANALFARLVEDHGHEAVYLTGAGVANMHLGAPDIGLTTLSEVANALAATSDAVTIPIVVDGDTGFGNEANVVRTIRVLERSGAAGIQLEDQVFPKRCGHFSGKHVISQSEMVAKIKAAVDTRLNGDLQIIARTDAREKEGLDRAIERAHAYIEAGADATFIEAPLSIGEFRRIVSELQVPQFANIVYGGKTPDPGAKLFAEMGFSAIIYANVILQAAIKAASGLLADLRSTGELAGIAHRPASFEERQRVVQKDKWDAIEARYIG